MVKVDYDFFAAVEGVGDCGVFWKIGGRGVGEVFDSEGVVARDWQVDVECACAVGLLIAGLLVASDADAFDRLVGLSRAHLAIDATVEVVAIVWCIACLKYECY